MKISVLGCFVFSLFIVNIYCTTSMQDALITNLPGLDFSPNFKQYSGYVTVDNTKEMFYWFTESQNNPSTDPVVLWLQGGPGCSGIGAGLLQEDGPFYPNLVDANNKIVGLRENFYSWNKIANMIYVDSPCGVGFSYSNKESDYINNDNQTASDNFEFLKGFFEVYTDFADNDFWITGESYGGVYIPTLAYHILTNDTAPQLKTNLKNGGLMLGNPVTSCEGSDFSGKDDINFLNNDVQLWYYRGMVSYTKLNEWQSNGCDTSAPPSFLTCENIYREVNRAVGFFDQPLKNKKVQQTSNFDNEEMIRESEEFINSQKETEEISGAINPDCLYYSYCTGNSTLDFNSAQVPDCFGVDDQIDSYLNNNTARQALHVNTTKKWRSCGGVLYSSNAGPLMPYINQFFQIAPTMRINYYSGDIDINTVPFSGTQRCLYTLNRPVKEAWRPWVVDKEIAGYVEIYDTYQYMTIKGAGHEAPAYQPAASYTMFEKFINNEPLPSAP